MSDVSWSLSPHTIHVNEDPASAIARAHQAGALFFRWSLAGVRNIRELGLSAEQLFQPPYRSPSIDGMIDYASDLEWLESPHGLLLVVDAQGARDKVALMAARAMAPVGDRWRAAGKPFEAYLVAIADVRGVLDELEQVNEELDEFGRTHPIQSGTARLAVSAAPQPQAVTAPRRHPIRQWSRRGA